MSTVAVNDVVQMDPASCPWGPVFLVVTEVKDWGIQGYFLTDFEHGKPPGLAYYRAPHGSFVRIGQAEWAAPR